LGRVNEPVPLGLDDVEALAAELRADDYPPGTVLVRAGQAPARIHIVRSGAVELSCDIRGRQVVLQVLRSGDVVGDVPFFLGTTELFDAVTLEDSYILSIDPLTLYRLLQERPRLAWRWITSLSTRLASAQARLVELLAGGLEAQIALVLVHQAEDGVVHLRQSILADLVGGRRPSVNQILKRLEAQKLLRLRYGQIEILDEAGLATVAGLDDHGLRANQTIDQAVPPRPVPPPRRTTPDLGELHHLTRRTRSPGKPR
jgi:CRP-like cAMP-binding protein